jgi:hypothetical protein
MSQEQLDSLIGDWRISLLVECLFYFVNQVICSLSLIGLIHKRMQLSCVLVVTNYYTSIGLQ